MNVRQEAPTDHDAILQIHRVSFGGEAEAALVDRLRREQADQISLVAIVETAPIGHALFSEAELVLASEVIRIGALGPVAVLPAHRRRGVATALIREGLRLCWERGWPALIVLGNPAYYGRFGFARADTLSIRCELDVPAEAFMIAFAAAAIPGPGVARYHPAFANV